MGIPYRPGLLNPHVLDHTQIAGIAAGAFI
jgi:hypothetical protein